MTWHWPLVGSPLGAWSRRQPALWAGVVLMGVVCWAGGTWRQAQRAQQGALLQEQQGARGRQAAAQLTRLVPPMWVPEGPRQLAAQIEAALRASGASERALSSFAVQAVGLLPQVPVQRQQARAELRDLTLRQAGQVLEALETSGAPYWIEATEWRAAGGPSERWHLTVEIQWLLRADPPVP